MRIKLHADNEHDKRDTKKADYCKRTAKPLFKYNKHWMVTSITYENNCTEALITLEEIEL